MNSPESKPNNNENFEKLRETAKKVNDFLEPLVKKIFDVNSRIAYEKANEEQYQEGIQELKDTVENLGTVTDDLKKKAQDLIDERHKTQNLIIELTLDLDELNLVKTSFYISKIEGARELEKRISDVYAPWMKDVEDWESFVEEVNRLLRISPLSWERLREYSENK